jgi:hypothetical protein
MIDVASRATNGVKIPSTADARTALMNKFKENVTHLRERLNVRCCFFHLMHDKTHASQSDAVPGLISLTTDAWQASNADAYVAVTGHWIESDSKGNWKAGNALLGFTQMNTAHDGVRLGNALYRIANRYGIAHRVRGPFSIESLPLSNTLFQQQIGWVTCDSASNNTTMLKEFAKLVNARADREGNPWDPIEGQIRCLAHIVNLATQALLAEYSKSNHYDPAKPDQVDVAAGVGGMRDVVGLQRKVTVKVCFYLLSLSLH